MSLEWHDAKSAQPKSRYADPMPRAKDLYALAPTQAYPRGVELFRQGVRTEEVFYVASGIVKFVHANRDGAEVILDLAFAGAWPGSAAAIVDIPSPVTAVTCTRGALRRIPVLVFRTLLEQDPEVSRCIRDVHAHELCSLTASLALRSRTSRERLERVLRQLILALGLTASERGIVLRFPLRHWEIARLIAVTPEHLSRLLTQMQTEGVIRREKGWLIVPDLNSLCACEETPR